MEGKQMLWKRPGLDDILRRLLIVGKIRNDQPVVHEDLYQYLEKELSDRGINIDSVSLARKSINIDIRLIRLEFGVTIRYRKLTDTYHLDNIKRSTTVDRFLDTFDILVSLNALNQMPDFVFSEDYCSVGAKGFYLLVKAIEKSVCIHFSYVEIGEQLSKEYYVEPYAIREYNKRWYVIARTVGKQDMKAYAMDNVSNLRMVDVWVQKDKTINLAEDYKYTYGMDDKGRLEDLVLSFDCLDGDCLKNQPLHFTQEIVKDAKDEFVIQLRIRITDDFVRKLMMFPSLKVLRPAVLRRKICDYCHETLRQNRN